MSSAICAFLLNKGINTESASVDLGCRNVLLECWETPGIPSYARYGWKGRLSCLAARRTRCQPAVGVWVGRSSDRSGWSVVGRNCRALSIHSESHPASGGCIHPAFLLLHRGLYSTRDVRAGGGYDTHSDRRYWRYQENDRKTRRQGRCRTVGNHELEIV